jgi:hypothetical protein
LFCLAGFVADRVFQKHLNPICYQAKIRRLIPGIFSKEHRIRPKPGFDVWWIDNIT